VELAIAAISGAGSVVAVALVLYLMHRSAAAAERAVAESLRDRIKLETRMGELAARVSMLDGKLLAAVTSAEQWKAAASEQETRANEMSEALWNLASELPASGARERVLSRWTNAARASGATTSIRPTLPVPSEPTTAGSDDLERPE
jgi:septal ring factor EnvC (AmiA/AmiB activator)